MHSFVTIFLCMNFGLLGSIAAPIEYDQMQLVPIALLPPSIPTITGPKFVWNFLGDIISGSGFLPIEINVPDTVGNIASGAQTVAQGLASAAGNLIQRIPFFTRITSAETPRPLKFVLHGGRIVAMMPS